MRMQVYDKDFGKDDFIGEGTVDLTEVFMRKNVNNYYPIYRKKGKKLSG